MSFLFSIRNAWNAVQSETRHANFSKICVWMGSGVPLHYPLKWYMTQNIHADGNNLSWTLKLSLGSAKLCLHCISISRRLVKIHPRLDFQLSFLPATPGSLYQHCFRCITLSAGSLIKRKGLKQATGAYLKTERIWERFEMETSGASWKRTTSALSSRYPRQTPPYNLIW